MLSILIPVYNFDLRNLVETLNRQCLACQMEFEILCYDDCSDEKYKKINREIQQLEGVRYRELPKNLGRAKIRNVLGKVARFPYLLFMDCDSKVVRKDFIEKYLIHLKPNVLVYGGRSYSSNPPRDSRLFFHWHYGRQREQTSPEHRKIAPWHSFMTNNFLIPKTLFLEIQFDDSLRQYGHEDTLFGMELKSRSIPIIHIDNPLQHIGLEPTEVSLEKSKKAMQNLLFLKEKNPLIDSRLLRSFDKFRKRNLLRPLAYFYLRFEPLFLKNFQSKRPSLRLFDFYKLSYLSWLYISKKKKQLRHSKGRGQ